jgi:peptidoglycan hydrolase CwlO-like protein
MAEAITSLIAAIPSGALPIVVVILGLAYLYFKFNKVEKDREVTKQQRDSDSQAIHDDILKLKFDVTNLQGIVNLHKDKLESIDKQLGLVNQELVKLNIQVEHLATALEKQNEIMMEQMKTKK